MTVVPGDLLTRFDGSRQTAGVLALVRPTVQSESPMRTRLIKGSRILLGAGTIVLLAFGFTSTHHPVARSRGPSASTSTAIFAGGCFWCMEPPFERMPGVLSVTAGYAGGNDPRPTYDQVSEGGTGHREVVEVLFDPEIVSYQQVVAVFWSNIDPTDDRGQFCDSGQQYRSAIFYRGEDQRKAAEDSKRVLESRLTVVTDLLPAGPFFPAEEDHQDYYRKNPVRYEFYRLNCGRAYRLAQIRGNSP